MTDNLRMRPFIFAIAFLITILAVGSEVVPATLHDGQTDDRLTPMQREIERQRRRLSSEAVEERRDALMRLGNLKRPEASRAAAAALNDIDPMVRVTAAHAVVHLPQPEAAALLIPLLQDKLEFVRREVAYALGETRSRSALGPLTALLSRDKEAGVRGAAAVALGRIGDESAVGALSQVLLGSAQPQKKSKAREDDFVMRAAARSLGQLRSRAGVSVLIATLTNELNDGDVRREAATALGLIGDKSAEAALRSAFSSSDPYLSEAAREALRKLALAGN